MSQPDTLSVLSGLVPKPDDVRARLRRVEAHASLLRRLLRLSILAEGDLQPRSALEGRNHAPA